MFWMWCSTQNQSALPFVGFLRHSMASIILCIWPGKNKILTFSKKPWYKSWIGLQTPNILEARNRDQNKKKKSFQEPNSCQKLTTAAQYRVWWCGGDLGSLSPWSTWAPPCPLLSWCGSAGSWLRTPPVPPSQAMCWGPTVKKPAKINTTCWGHAVKKPWQ